MLRLRKNERNNAIASHQARRLKWSEMVFTVKSPQADVAAVHDCAFFSELAQQFCGFDALSLASFLGAGKNLEDDQVRPARSEQ
jgi:hypothetical protein